MRSLRSPLLREDHICPWWLANPLRRFLHDPATLLSPHVREGMIVADTGCGMGYFSIALAALVGAAGTVIAVDVQQEMLDRTRKRAVALRPSGLAGPLLGKGTDHGSEEDEHRRTGAQDRRA